MLVQRPLRLRRGRQLRGLGRPRRRRSDALRHDLPLGRRPRRAHRQGLTPAAALMPAGPADPKGGILTTKPAFTAVLQVGVVVRDLDQAVRTYNDEYGIGPWRILEINPDLAQDLTIDEHPAAYSMRVALTMIGDVQW